MKLKETWGSGHSDYTGAAALMNSLPEADWLLADRGYDADWFRETLVDKALHPRSQVAQKDRQVRQAPQPHRKDVWQAERLVTYLNPLRQIPNRLLLCNCSRRSRHLLVISPDPKCCIEQRYLIIEENHGLGPLNRGFSYCIDESFDGV